MLQGEGLECVRGERRLFTGLDFSLVAGELLHLQGANGSGKTSLLRIVCGLAHAAEGRVTWQGENIRALREDFWAQLLYIGHAAALKDDLTALENLRISAGLAGDEVDEEKALQALARIGLGGREDLPARVLSQGQRRRVALARLLVEEARPLWVLDEPFSALDVRAVALLEEVISAHLGRGGMVLLTTHQAVGLTAGVARPLPLDS